MTTTRTLLLSGVLALTLAVPALAQAEDARTEMLGDLGRSIDQVQAELAAIDQRQASEDWMVFDSSSRGLIEVELSRLDEFVPAVRTLRKGDASVAAMNALADTMPDLWEATVLLTDAPDWVLEAGGDTVIAWLRDRFGHLQTPERKAELYDARRSRLRAELEALRHSQEYFQGEMLLAEQSSTEQTVGERPEGESAEVEAFCQEIALGETLVAEDGTWTYLGEPIPPIEDLPEWCRDALLARLVGQTQPALTPAAEEVVAAEPVHRSEDDIGVEPLADIEHGRWDGVWEYWGAPTLTLQQVGDYVYGTYQDGDGWMKLAVVNERALMGRWYEHEHAATCDDARDGTVHWGTLAISFDEDFGSYWGDFGTCDSLGTYISGERAR